MHDLKKVLIIGNGFDIAHGLPTSYPDFLDFSKNYIECVEKIKESGEKSLALANVKSILNTWIDGNEDIKDLMIADMKGLYNVINSNVSEEEKKHNKYYFLFGCLKNNFWFEYIYTLYIDKISKGNKWIDFESEISEMIQWLDSMSLPLDEGWREVSKKLHKYNDHISYNRFLVLKNDFFTSQPDGVNCYEDFIDYLYNDLEQLTKALELYLSMYVEEIPLKVNPLFEEINADFIISFNYTHTYERYYKSFQEDDVHIVYVHGECGKELTATGLVLGIDEYNVGEDMNVRTDMSVFKKFVQRIRKSTDTSHEWYSRIIQDDIHETVKYNPQEDIEVHVFGHSLGVTDKDILRKWLQPKQSRVFLYPHTRINEGKLISNLIRIIDEETVINKSNGIPKRLTIKFIEKSAT